MNASSLVALLALVGCGGRVMDASVEDASPDADAVDATVDVGNDLEAGTPVVVLDAASCAMRAISATCADGGVRDFLWTTIHEKCWPPGDCAVEFHVTIDSEGCPTSVLVNGHGDYPSLPDVTACMARSMAAERWACGDAGALFVFLGFGSCTN